jgi:hypothetical protein
VIWRATESLARTPVAVAPIALGRCNVPMPIADIYTAAMLMVQATYIVLAALLGWSLRHPRNSPIATGVERFRVSGGIRWSEFGFALAFAAAGLALIVFTHGHGYADTTRLRVGVVDALAAANLYLFLTHWALAIDVDDDGVRLTTLFGDRRWANSAIHRVDISSGGLGKGPRKRVILYDVNGRRIVRVDGRSFPELDRFALLMKLNLTHSGTLIREYRRILT